MENDKILVLGSNSFSGASFLRYLIEHDFAAIGVSRSKEPHHVFLPHKSLNNYSEKYQFVQADLNHDLDLLIRLIKNEQPSYVVNFAALGMVAQSWQQPEDWYQTNVVSQVKFHDQLRKFEFIKI